MEKRVLKSLFDLEFDSRLFIEASAGTGKTYTIVGLFLRLLIEKGLNVDQILVMTFTKKATAELRERIFARLRDVLNYLKTGKIGEIGKNGETGENGDTGFMIDLEKAISGLDRDRDQLIRHLKESIRNFDESQIYTIHSFCQKILREEALIAGMPFEVEITQQDDLLLEAAEDEWRLFMAVYQSDEPGRYYIRKLMSLADTPAELVKKLMPHFSRSYAEIEGDGHDDPIRYLERVLNLRKKITDQWFAEKEKLRQEFSNCDLKGYTENGIENWFSELDQAVSENPFKEITFTNFKRFTSSYQHDPSNLRKDGTKIPEHPFFDHCQEYVDQLSEMDRVTTNLISHFYEAIKSRRRRLSDDSKTLTYDDLLQKVSDALQDPHHGTELASVILKKVPYALVDEFQDTDPVQYQIFDTIYPKTGDESGLLMIGDPKQAIYAFRGADIYTYLKARNQCEGEGYALQKNYRSSRELIHAVNSLFEGDHVPFLEKEIPFYPSEAGDPEHSHGLLIHGEPPKALQLSLSNDFYTNKTDALDFSIGETVSQIVRLLNLSKQGKATIKGRELRAADMCILVNSHRDASAIKRALKHAGVGAVTYSKDKVFETFEAVRLNLALLAILEPQNQRKVQAALLNGFFGLSLSAIERIRNDESEFQSFIEELQELNELWHRSGFYPMFRALLYRKDRLANLAEMEFSERILTNLLQLADICSKAEREGQLSPHELISWIHRQMTDPDQDDEKTLLLESDQNLVKISTIHSSKGLEFPIVFIPAPWTGFSSSGRKDLFEIYHDRERDQTVINIDQTKSAERREAAQMSQFESLADDVRKFYVAVTRAKYQCHLCWATHANSHYSGLGAAVLGREQILNLIGESRNKIREDDDLNQQFFVEHFSNLAKKHPELIDLDVKKEAISEKNAVKFDPEPVKTMQSRGYIGRRVIPVQKRLESFSSLVHHKSEPGEPDYDQIVQSYAEQVSREPIPYQDPIQEADRTIFSFPRGATAGSAIHKVFEHEQFDFRNAGRTADEEWAKDEEWIGAVLDQFRIDPDWSPVVRKMLYDASGALIPGLSLDQIGREDQLREMEFHFGSQPVRTEELFDVIRNGSTGWIDEKEGGKSDMSGHDGETMGGQGFMPGRNDEAIGGQGVTSGRVDGPLDRKRSMAGHEGETMGGKGYQASREDGKVDGKGYMTGFIDLIVRQSGKYYILDYKSNYLGDTAGDYEASKLEFEMRKAGYDLQAQLYMVALVKYLNERLPDFSYDRDIGGVAYLFVRGLEHGSGNGVWFQKPDEQVVRNLERILSRG